jgi:hypothetical protein
VLKHDGKALIDLVDGLSLGSVVLIGVVDGDFVDLDARLGAEPPNVSQAMTNMRRPLRRHFSSSKCFLAVAALAGDQTLSHRTIDEGEL